MTTPNVKCTCTGTCHPSTTFGHSIHPHAVGVLTARTRSCLASNVRMGIVSGDTGKQHGPDLPTLSFRLGSGHVSIRAAGPPITEQRS